jgi:hypothetical protein
MRITGRGNKYYYTTDIPINLLTPNMIVGIIENIIGVTSTDGFSHFGITVNEEGNVDFEFLTSKVLPRGVTYNVEMVWIAEDEQGNSAKFESRPNVFVAIRQKEVKGNKGKGENV